MEFETIIEQNGEITCPFCKNKIKWKLKVKKSVTENDLDKYFYTTQAEPPYVYYDFNADNTINVKIGCEKCGNSINTLPLPLKAE